MMDNVNYEVRGQELIIRVDLTNSGIQTRGGNAMVATTGNWVPLPELGTGWSMNFVVVRKPGARIPARLEKVG